MKHGVQGPTKRRLDPSGQAVSTVGRIGEDHLQASELVLELDQDQTRSLTVLAGSNVHDDRQNQPSVSTAIWRFRPESFLWAS